MAFVSNLGSSIDLSKIEFDTPTTILNCLKIDLESKNTVVDKDKVQHLIKLFTGRRKQHYVLGNGIRDIPDTYHPYALGSLQVMHWSIGDSNKIIDEFNDRIKILKLRKNKQKWITKFCQEYRSKCYDYGDSCPTCFPPPVWQVKKKQQRIVREVIDDAHDEYLRFDECPPWCSCIWGHRMCPCSVCSCGKCDVNDILCEQFMIKHEDEDELNCLCGKCYE